jgi:hypothetical protein
LLLPIRPVPDASPAATDDNCSRCYEEIPTLSTENMTSPRLLREDPAGRASSATMVKIVSGRAHRAIGATDQFDGSVPFRANADQSARTTISPSMT